MKPFVDTVFGHVTRFGRVWASKVSKRCFIQDALPMRLVADEGVGRDLVHK